MSSNKSSDHIPTVETPALEQLDPLIEVSESAVNEEMSETEQSETTPEIRPRIFGVFDIKDELTLENLKNVIYELGIVDLCWPDIEDPVFEGKTAFPKSYYTNSTKERLLLAYAENFRRQFIHNRFQHKALLLQAPNECGLQKMVCTTIRPTKLCYKGMDTWRGCASLIADFFDYEPLAKPMLLPDRIISPQTCLERRAGNCFELATVLASYMLGSGYDVYVIHGYADRDVTVGYRGRTDCPYVPAQDDDDDSKEEEEVDKPEPKYKLLQPPDMSSKYEADMRAREQKKIQDELDKIDAERQAEIAELEKPPPDDMDRWRTHGWVLVLPSRDVSEPFFIEPSEGEAYTTDDARYHAVHAAYNHENYYVNMQDARDLANIQYDLLNVDNWEHLLAGEPAFTRSLPGVDLADPATAVLTDKHLDMPASWVEKLSVSSSELEKRYPGGHKIVRYKKCTLEKFSRYSRHDGLVHRIIVYGDYELTLPLMEYNRYEQRVDKMYKTTVNHERQLISEAFYTGREDFLKTHRYEARATPGSIEARRTMTFFYYARLDHLTEVETTPFGFNEKFTDRPDRLETRKVEYSPAAAKGEPRALKKIVEVFSRNPDVPAVEDVHIRTFLVQEEKIELEFHYAYNFVTMSTREYVKPNLAETGGKILYDPDKTTCYIADPNEKPQRPLNIYYLLCENMALENQTRKHIRDYESDVIGYLRARHHELTDPQLYVYLFDTERNEKAKRALIEKETQKREVTDREIEPEMDPLTPYLARMFGPELCKEPLSYKAAAMLRDQCLNDFKARQLARQNLVQDRFDAMNSEYKNKRLWYLANQFVLTPAKEQTYFESIGRLAFEVHVLEVRLMRHCELSAARAAALRRALNMHPLLKEHARYGHFRD